MSPDRQEQNLDEKDFVRSKLFDGGGSAWQRYAFFTIGEPSIWKLVRYELIVMLFGSLPGALGFVLRKKFYKYLFKSCGRSVNFGRSLTLRNVQNISCGDDVVIDDYVLLDGRGADVGGIHIGSRTIIGRNAIIQSKVGPITIGDDCNIGSSSAIVAHGGIEIANAVQIAGGCMISGGRFRLALDESGKAYYQRYTLGPVRIGEACFIGAHAAVMDGVTVGKHCVLGTAAVLTNDLPENTVYMARPGMVIGKTIANPPSAG